METREDLYKHLKRGMLMVIYEEMEKVRRYWAHRFAHLINLGLEAESFYNTRIEGNKVILTITVVIPEKFISKSVDYILRRREKAVWRRATWGEEMKVEEELLDKEETESSGEGESVEVEFVEGAEDIRSRQDLQSSGEDREGAHG